MADKRPLKISARRGRIRTGMLTTVSAPFHLSSSSTIGWRISRVRDGDAMRDAVGGRVEFA
jgi:hypothetical protein